MTDQPTAQGPTFTLPPPPVGLPPPRKRGGLKIAGMIGGGLVLLLAGVGIGSSAGGKTVTNTVTVPGPTVTVTAPAAAAPSVSVSAKAVTKPKPAGVVLSVSGTGMKNTAPFTIASGILTASYTYNCSSYGSSDNFIVDLQTPNQSNGNGDDQQIANVIGNGGSATTNIYPQNVGSQYYLAVQTDCNWSVTIKSP